MEILKVAGYVRDPVRELWFSRHRRRAFSYEALSDHDSRWLERKLLDDVPDGSLPRALLNLFVLFHKSYFPGHQAALLDLSGRNSTNFIAAAS